MKFPIVTGALQDKASIVIWTTTPWTLPANLAIAVHPKELYVVQEFTASDGVNRKYCCFWPTLVAQFSAATGFEPTWRADQSFPGNKARRDRRAASVSATHRHRPHRRFRHDGNRHRRVHIAPGHGEDDYSLGKTNGLPILSPVDDHGRYTEEAGLPELTGKYVFDANRRHRQTAARDAAC